MDTSSDLSIISKYVMNVKKVNQIPHTMRKRRMLPKV